MGEMEEMAHMLADEFDLRDKWEGRNQIRIQGHKFLGISDVPAATTERLESCIPCKGQLSGEMLERQLYLSNAVLCLMQ